jgi:hypothetical protein
LRKLEAARQLRWHDLPLLKLRQGKNSAAAESEGGQKFLPPNPLHFCPPERSVWRAKRAVSSVQKRFGFRQTNAPERKLQVRARRLASLGGSRVLYFRLKTEFAISFEGKKNF